MNQNTFDEFLEHHSFLFSEKAIPTPCLPLGLLPTAAIMRWWECKISYSTWCGSSTVHFRHFVTPAHADTPPTLREALLLLTADAMSYWAHDGLASFHRVVMPTASQLVAELHFEYVARRADTLARLLGPDLQAYLQAWSGVAEVHDASPA